jgi:hypothetical protein
MKATSGIVEREPLSKHDDGGLGKDQNQDQDHFRVQVKVKDKEKPVI